MKASWLQEKKKSGKDGWTEGMQKASSWILDLQTCTHLMSCVVCEVSKIVNSCITPYWTGNTYWFLKIHYVGSWHISPFQKMARHLFQSCCGCNKTFWKAECLHRDLAQILDTKKNVINMSIDTWKAIYCSCEHIPSLLH